MAEERLEDRLRKYAGFLEEQEIEVKKELEGYRSKLDLFTDLDQKTDYTRSLIDPTESELEKVKRMKDVFYRLFPEYKPTEASSVHP